MPDRYGQPPRRQKPKRKPGQNYHFSQGLGSHGQGTHGELVKSMPHPDEYIDYDATGNYTIELSVWDDEVYNISANDGYDEKGRPKPPTKSRKHPTLQKLLPYIKRICKGQDISKAQIELDIKFKCMGSYHPDGFVDFEEREPVSAALLLDGKELISWSAVNKNSKPGTYGIAEQLFKLFEREIYETEPDPEYGEEEWWSDYDDYQRESNPNEAIRNIAKIITEDPDIMR